MKDTFWYLRLILQSNGGINDNVSHKMITWWVKWRQTSSIFCDKKISNKLKDKLYIMVNRYVMMYGVEYRATKGQHIQWNVNVALDVVIWLQICCYFWRRISSCYLFQKK
jgi:hypothetical protein